MAKHINPERCVRCNACLPECASESITVTNIVYIVDPRLCAECAGMYARSLFAGTCPVDAVDTGVRDEARPQAGRAAGLQTRRSPRG